MIDINVLLKEVMDLGASDLHITVAIKPTVRIHGDLMELDYPKLLPEDTEHLCNQILSGHHKEMFLQNGEVDLSYTYPGIARFRVNVSNRETVWPWPCVQSLQKFLPWSS